MPDQKIESKPSAPAEGNVANRNHKENIAVLKNSTETLLATTAQYLDVNFPKIDTDKDGKLSKSELSVEINRITTATIRGTLEGAMVPSMRAIAATFDKVAGLDGKSDSISKDDLATLGSGALLVDSLRRKKTEEQITIRTEKAALVSTVENVSSAAFEQNMKAVDAFIKTLPKK